jgi:hypothetical protein
VAKSVYHIDGVEHVRKHPIFPSEHHLANRNNEDAHENLGHVIGGSRLIKKFQYDRNGICRKMYDRYIVDSSYSLFRGCNLSGMICGAVDLKRLARLEDLEQCQGSFMIIRREAYVK